jgi:hypothetical protein
MTCERRRYADESNNPCLTESNIFKNFIGHEQRLPQSSIVYLMMISLDLRRNWQASMEKRLNKQVKRRKKSNFYKEFLIKKHKVIRQRLERSNAHKTIEFHATISVSCELNTLIKYINLFITA